MDRAVVLHLASREEAGSRPLEEVRDEIATRLKDEQAAKRADSAAQKLLEELKKGTTIAELAASNSAKLLSYKAILRDSKLLPPELVGAIFKAPHPSEGHAVPLRVKKSIGRTDSCGA
jgi:hypothetical protein